ncbi:MAG: tripartite tricarboxylate transporter substrate binding protein [Candidatus Rokubacteria bacterium]|nr:tripartite tricarboxylate transporter substrate binding protein [Candidatus Rokubacteria bacterium]
MRTIVSLLALAATLLGAALPVAAQTYPSGAITLVIPLAPGDGTDVAGRAMAEELSKLLKVAVVPVNRPGGGMAIGTDSVVKAKKDGYTILITPNAALVSGRILNPDTVLYDPVKDLTYLGGTTRTPVILTVRGDAWKTLPELVEFAKKNPGKVRAASVGPGSIGHFSVEMVNALTGAGITHVPFKGGGPGMTALLGGHVELGAFSVGATAGHLRSGAMRGLVVSSKSPVFPEIPTMPELGYRQNLPGIWFAFYGPAGLPAEVTKVLVAAIEKIVKDPAVATKLAPFGMVQEYNAPEKVVAEIREEQRVLEDLARKAGLAK